jgi:hypothetical protein
MKPAPKRELDRNDSNLLNEKSSAQQERHSATKDETELAGTLRQAHKPDAQNGDRGRSHENKSQTVAENNADQNHLDQSENREEPSNNYRREKQQKGDRSTKRKIDGPANAAGKRANRGEVADTKPRDMRTRYGLRREIKKPDRLGY